jgi:hypothetical protein
MQWMIDKKKEAFCTYNRQKKLSKNRVERIESNIQGPYGPQGPSGFILYVILFEKIFTTCLLFLFFEK